MMLHSQVKASLTIYDAWLDLQDGFTHTGQGDGRPASGFFPLVISPTSRAGMLFSICLVTEVAEGMPISSLALCISYQSLIKLYKPRVMYLTMTWDVILLDILIWKFEASIVEMLHNARSSCLHIHGGAVMSLASPSKYSAFQIYGGKNIYKFVLLTLRISCLSHTCFPLWEI